MTPNKYAKSLPSEIYLQVIKAAVNDKTFFSAAFLVRAPLYFTCRPVTVTVAIIVGIGKK